MTDLDIKRLGLILAVQAEIDGMKFADQLQLINYENTAYPESAYVSKAEELRNLVYAPEEAL